MDKADGLGTGVALVGHAALFAALSFGLAASIPPKPAPPPAMEVEFVDTVALEAVAAPSTDAMAQAEAPKVGTPEDAMPQPAPAPEPLPPAPAPEPVAAPLVPLAPPPAPVATPVPKPEPVPAKPVVKAAPKPQRKLEPTLAKTATQTAPAKRVVADVAKLTPSKVVEPAPVKTRVVERPTRTAAPAKPQQLATAADKPTRIKSAPAKPQRARAAAAAASKPPTAPAKTASSTRASAAVPTKPAVEAGPPAVRAAVAKDKAVRAPRLGRDLLAGLTDAQDAKPAASAAPVMNPNAMAGIQAAIKRQVQPCADRQVNPGPGANRISVKLNLKLNKDGSLASAPQVVSTTGIDDENSRYEKRVADLAVAAFTGCAPLAGLPDELYRTSKGGWSNFIMNYRLPG